LYGTNKDTQKNKKFSPRHIIAEKGTKVSRMQIQITTKEGTPNIQNQDNMENKFFIRETNHASKKEGKK
jgi:hypothetical protein